MNSAVTTSFDPMMVALSFAFAVIGSFVALSAAARLASGGGKQSRSGLLTIGVALGGIGVWSMHFVGMLALKMDVGSSYSMTETLVSLVVVIVSTSLAVNYAAKAPKDLVRLVTAGSLLGLSVVVMHYLGMFGLKINGYIRWDYGIVVLSAVIAVVAATAALWLAFNSNSLEKRLLAAVAMGVAVCAMHYTGMYAAEFICTTENRNAIPQGTGFISAFRLPSMVIVPTVLMVVMLSIDVVFQNASTVVKRRR
jgi:NO-binding membrane sensor protein with MHYT domain